MHLKRMVVLAYSRKMGGICVAGIEVDPDRRLGNWIRPVSALASGELHAAQTVLVDGRQPALLDIVELPLESAKAHTYQSENWLMAVGTSWKKLGSLSPQELYAAVDNSTPLWYDNAKTLTGENNCIPEQHMKGIGSSLRLVRVPGLALHVSGTGVAGASRRKVEGAFYLGNESYKLAVTDIQLTTRLLNGPNTTYHYGPCLLTISLGEPFEGAIYKLIAAVIPVE